MNTKSLEESLWRLDALIRRKLFLGNGRHTALPYYLSPDEFRSTHTHLVGATGFGKSFYLEHLLRSYVKLGVPASLIDPHGDQAAQYVEFLARTYRAGRRTRVIRFRPGWDDNGVGFNPFHCGLSDPAEIASLVLEAFMKVWGAHSFNETPRLERVLRIMFHTFATNRLPLTESYQFLTVANRPLRAELLANVADESIRASWEEIERMPQSEKLMGFESSWNRLQRFLSIPAVAKLFAVNGRTLDVSEALRNGDVLVADLSRLHSTEAKSLVGAMLMNAIYHAALRRPRKDRHPCVLAIDEFPQFITADIARSLDQVRKFGLHLILAHQHLTQVPPELRSSLLTNAKVRVVFGGLERMDAEILARELFTGDVSGESVKWITTQTKFEPILETRDIETISESETEGDSESESRSSSFSSESSESHGEMSGDETVTKTLSTASSMGDAHGRSKGNTRSHARTEGRSQSTVYVTEHRKFMEETGRQFRTLEEEWEKLVARIMRLDRREALVKVFNRLTIDIRTPEVRRFTRLVRKKRRSKVATPENRGNTPRRTSFSDLPDDFRE